MRTGERGVADWRVGLFEFCPEEPPTEAPQIERDT
jgi:hypothetical protein